MKSQKKKSAINPLHEWFAYLFEEQMDKDGYVKCFECGNRMHQDTYKELSICYSHILPKSKYPDLAGDPDNVVIVHPDCHNLYTMQPRKAKNQYNYFLKLKELHHA